MYWVGEIFQALSYTNFAVVSRKTAFNIDWLFLNTLHTLHGNETFSSLATAYNDFLNDRWTIGKFFLFAVHCHSYELPDTRRLEMNEKRAKDGFLTYWFLELCQR